MFINNIQLYFDFDLLELQMKEKVTHQVIQMSQE